MIDQGFIRRTYRTTLYVWAFVVFALLAFQLWFVAIGFTVGTALSFGVLASLDYIVRRIFVPGAEGAGRAFAKVGILKLAAIAAVVSGVVLTRRGDLIAGFCVGVVLTQAVMFLKAVGASLANRTGSQGG
jgi:hypothetical protein